MPTPEDIRTQILALVKEYHTAKFAPKAFDPEKDLVHYAGRVFDAEEIVNLVDVNLGSTYTLGKMRDCTLFCEAKLGAVPVFSQNAKKQDLTPNPHPKR
jgi:hypothetical protein